MSERMLPARFSVTDLHEEYLPNAAPDDMDLRDVQARLVLALVELDEPSRNADRADSVREALVEAVAVIDDIEDRETRVQVQDLVEEREGQVYEIPRGNVTLVHDPREDESDEAGNSESAA